MKKIIKDLHHVPGLQQTSARMLSDGRITAAEEAHINSNLAAWASDSKYILFNLGAHISIGLVRFTAIPIPFMGSILRVLWVIANRLYCDIRWDMRRKKIHSLAVFAFAAIPFLGYFAYTVPLKEKSEYLTYLYIQHISYMLYNMTIEEKLNKAPRLIKDIGYKALIPKSLRRA